MSRDLAAADMATVEEITETLVSGGYDGTEGQEGSSDTTFTDFGMICGIAQRLLTKGVEWRASYFWMRGQRDKAVADVRLAIATGQEAAAIAGRQLKMVLVLREALEGMIQCGIDEEGKAWIAANPSGVSHAAEVIGINAETIKAAARPEDQTKEPGAELRNSGEG